MTDQAIVYEYEELLLGNRKTFGGSLSQDTVSAEHAVQVLFKYVIEDILHWSPDDAAAYLTWHLIKQLKLDVLVKHLEYPQGLSKQKDIDYLIHVVYPKQFKYDTKEQCISEYKKVLAGGYSFRKNYFTNEMGIRHAGIILTYIISMQGFTSVDEIYEFFADKASALKFLSKHKIANNAKILYESPLEYLHYSLPDSQRSEFLYHFYLFNNQYKVATKM